MWTIFTILAAVLLVITFFEGQNAVWGGILFGGFIGLVIAIIYAIRGSGFYFTTIGKGIVVGVIVGAVAELLGKVGDRMKTSKHH